MKTLWYLCATMLAIGVLAGFSSITPTSAVIANIAPSWDNPTSNFFVGDNVKIDLNFAFFDPDADLMIFNSTSSAGIKTRIINGTLQINATQEGEVMAIAYDGKQATTQIITITKN